MEHPRESTGKKQKEKQKKRPSRSHALRGARGAITRRMGVCSGSGNNGTCHQRNVSLSWSRRTSHASIHPSGCRERRQLPHGSIACTQLCVMAMDADLDAQHCLDSGSGGSFLVPATLHTCIETLATRRERHITAYMCSDERNDLLRRETCLRSYACSNVCWSYSYNWISSYC